MKNYEKYADEIMNIKSQAGWCDSFAKPKILAPLGRSCGNTACGNCTVLTLMWSLEDYEEPEVDWSNVEVDTPILVREQEGAEWFRRHFAKSAWKHAKLAESEEE